MIINNLAGGEVEITDIKRFLGGTEYDISDVYFGDKHIFESWRELESPLPITILAAGEDLIDYRIYGNTVQTGTPTPENPIMPIGCGERTENLFDKDAKDTSKGYMERYKFNSTGGVTTSANWQISEYISVNPGTTYTLSHPISGAYTNGSYICEYSGSYELINTLAQRPTVTTTAIVFTTSSQTRYVRIDNVFRQTVHNRAEDCFLAEGSTVPTSYIPYGYKLPMVVTNGTTTTTTPIYIGSDPLAEDEYVDFGKQKIYHMVNGTLTPTDPPVPIPALPTIEGETIIDYNPSTTPAVEPEKMYIKYKPQ